MIDPDDWKTPHAYWLAGLKGFPLLAELHKRRVFSIGKLVNGNFGIVERCDEHFDMDLTPDELKALGAELIRYAQEGA